MTNAKKLITPALVLFLICLAVSALLAGVNAITKDKIAAMEAEALEKSTRQVLPLASTFTAIEAEGVLGFVGKNGEGAVVGYVFINAAKGYGGDVTAVVGLDTEGAIVGISVDAPDETPGLGVNVEKDSFLSQFLGKPDGDFAVKENVTAQTGATYSSKAVAVAVNMALAQFKQVTEGGSAS